LKFDWAISFVFLLFFFLFFFFFFLWDIGGGRRRRIQGVVGLELVKGRAVGIAVATQ
jgi:hypothetical protein